MCVHTRWPCVCVYNAGESYNRGPSRIEQTARGRRVSRSSHTNNTLCCVLLLFCLQHKLHTHVPNSRHECVQSVGTDSEVDHASP